MTGRSEQGICLKNKSAIIWFTGLPCAGKTTIANLINRRLCADRYHSYLLDGDVVRRGLNSDLGFDAADRAENIRRLSEVAKMMADAGIVTIVASISPFREDRARARQRAADIPFIEVFVDTPLQVCEARDVKGHYHLARKGEIVNFTGISSPYEVPEMPDLRLETIFYTPEDLAEMVISYLLKKL